MLSVCGCFPLYNNNNNNTTCTHKSVCYIDVYMNLQSVFKFHPRPSRHNIIFPRPTIQGVSKSSLHVKKL